MYAFRNKYLNTQVMKGLKILATSATAFPYQSVHAKTLVRLLIDTE
jgi:hypothetical protein